MYHAAETGIVTLLLYLLTYSLCRAGFISPQAHRKFWNFVLAAAFISVALSGFFLALQVTYKWNIPNVRSFVRLHAETGTGLAFTGILHFIRHSGYFFTRNRETAEGVQQQRPWLSTPGLIGGNLFMAGLLSSSVQILLMREMMNISGGFELMSGIFLGAWLLATAAGSMAAVSSRMDDPPKINMFFSLSPLASISVMILLARFFLTPGESPSFLFSILFIFLTLFPFCFISGYLFLKLLGRAGIVNGYSPGKSYAIETAGGVLAGILVTFLASGRVNNYELLFLAVILSLAWTILNFVSLSTWKANSIKTLSATLICILFITDPDVLMRSLLLPGVSVTATHDTPYGNVTTCENNASTGILYNHRLLAYSGDIEEREENIHLAMLQARNPESVLLISGAPDSNVPELLKYPLRRITQVEGDAQLAKILRFRGETGSVKYTEVRSDGFRYVRSMSHSADVIILLTPPPSTLMTGRFYTVEFFAAVSKKLRDGGVFACTPGAAENYYNDESVKLYSSVYNSLKTAFRFVVPVAGNKLWFIASDSALSTGFGKLADEKGIINEWVNSGYFQDDLTALRSSELTELLGSGGKVNTAARPVAVFHSQLFSLSRSSNERIPVAVLLLLLLIVPLLLTGRKGLIMYTGAFTLSSFEIVVLLALQITAGNMYQYTGLIIASVMAGLAIGSGNPGIMLNSLSIRNKGLLAAFYYLFVAIGSSFLPSMGGTAAVIILLVFVSVPPAIITGSIFHNLTLNMPAGGSTALVYSADLSGSAAGFILTAGLLVPLAGMGSTLFILCGLIFTASIFGTNVNKY